MKNNYNKDSTLVRLTIGTALLLLIVLEGMLLSSGCLGINNTDDAKTAVLDVISPVVVLNGSSQYEKMYPSTTAIPTQMPTQTPMFVASPVPTSAIKAKQIDMYANGERWQKQWFRHVEMRKTNQLSEVAPKKPLEFGIVIYDHKFLGSYTWWSDVNGQYYKEIPRPGNKFLFVFVHEEVLGDPKTHIPNMLAFDESNFMVQVGKNLYYNDTTYNPVNHILEFDSKGDYYGISRVSAFGYTHIFMGQSTRYGTQYGGWAALKQQDVYIGQGNAIDGYIVYQVPASANDNDILLVGNFGAMGNAYWRFDIYAGN